MQNSKFTEREFIKFLRNQGITVNTNTKARGNLGICFKDRIDISNNLTKERKLSVLAHEYAHKIHYDLEKDYFGQGGSLEKLFKTDKIELILEELTEVTSFVDKNSNLEEIHSKKSEIKAQAKILTEKIKEYYPEFKKSENFKPVKDYLKKDKSHLKHLLKHQNIKIIYPVTKQEIIFGVDTIDQDFPEVPEFVKDYIKLKALDKKLTRLSRLTNKAKKYYNAPTELFARFIEGIFIDFGSIKQLAPVTYDNFIRLLDQGYYGKLKDLFILGGFLY